MVLKGINKLGNKFNSFFKKLFVIFIIITCSFSYIPTNSLAANDSDDKYPALIPAFADAIISKFVDTDTFSKNGNSNSNSGSDVITDYSETGDGWDSITTVTYPNGTKRTFRNYKQYQGSYSNNQYWGGTIHTSACGPSSIAIILSGYQIDADPGKVVDAFHELDYDYSSMEILQTVLKKKYNIDSEMESLTTSSIQHIRDNFKEGRPIITGVPNHFITYLGEDSNGNIILSDPGYSDRSYGTTLEDYVGTYGNRGFDLLLIKSNDNASKTSSNNSSNNNKSSNNKTKTSSNNGEYDIKDCNVSNGGYESIFTSGTTGRQYREFKQNASYDYPTIYNSYWGQECGTVATGIIGSGYKNLTMQDIANELNNNGGGTDFIKFLGDFTGQSISCNSVSSVNEFANALSKGSVAVIHDYGYSGRGHYLSVLDISKDKSQVYVSNPDIYGTGADGMSQGWNSINFVYNAIEKSEIYFVTNDGGTVDYTGDEITSNAVTEDKIFYIGDSTMVGLNAYGVAKSPSSYFFAEGGENADWVMKNYSRLNIPQDASCIVVEFGANGLYLGSKNWENTQELIDKLAEDYPNKEIFVLQVSHICDGYIEDLNFNTKLDEYNRNMKAYCDKKSGVNYINPTINVVYNNGSGYLKNEYAADPNDTSLGGGKIHFNHEGYKVWYNDMIKCIKEYIKLGNVKAPIDMSKNIIERQEGTDKKGYKINLDLDAEIENLLDQLDERGYHLENFLSTKNQKKYFKNMIKATIVTQYPDLRNAEDIAKNAPIDDNEVQGCIKIKRYVDGETKAFSSGNLKNPIDDKDENKGMYLSYMPYSYFMEKISNSEKDALNYFTIDSSNDIVVAGWETMEVEIDGPHQTNVGEIQGNVQIGNAPSDYWLQYTPRQQPYQKLTTKKINYLNQVSNYTMPFNLMWSLLVYGHNEDFVNDIAKLVIDTDIVIGCHDATNVRINTISKSGDTQGEAIININLTDSQREAIEHGTQGEELPKQSVTYKFKVTETDTLKTDTPSLNVMYANTWTAIYSKDYKLKVENKQEQEETVKLEDKELDSDTLIKIGNRYLANRTIDNQDLNKKVDEIIESEKDKILDENILKQQQEIDEENEKISYKYEILKEKLQEKYTGDHLTFMLSEKDVQSHMINMITGGHSRANIDAVFNTDNDLMVKYAKKYGDPSTLLKNTANSVEELQKDEELINKLTKNKTDYTQAKVNKTNIDSIIVEIRKMIINQQETINQDITTVTVVEIPNGVTWKTDKSARENSFVKILSKNPEAKTNLHGVSGWFFESMEHTAAIADLEDLIKMLFQYVYSDLDYGINPDDLKDLFDPEKMQSIGGESQPVNIGTSKLSDFLKVWENGAMRRYQNGEITDYNSSPYIYMCITQDKKEYIMCDDLFTGNNNRNYGYGICFYTGYDQQFLNTGYFRDEGIDITEAKYQNYGTSTLPVEIVDRIKERIIEDQRENARYLANSVGVELTDYQIDAIAACSYQGWLMGDFLRAYKTYGMTESIRYYSSGMKPGDSRYEANWKLFSTGIYTDEYGNELT